MSRGRRLRRVALLAVAALALGATAASGDEGSFEVLGSTNQVGQVDLWFFGPAGTTVKYDEEHGGLLRPLGRLDLPQGGMGSALGAVPWRCDRLTRRFVAKATTPDGQLVRSAFSVRTPSCGNRLAVNVPAHVARGGRIPIRLQDRWGIGDRKAIVCAVGAGVARRCVQVRPGRDSRPVMSIAAPRDGHVRVGVEYTGHSRALVVAVGTARPAPRAGGVPLLATGDSTIQGIDSYLADALGSAATVTSRSYPGLELTRPGAAWPQRAAADARQTRPRVVVMSVGASEGYPVQVNGQSVGCCGEDWTADYVQRVRSVAQAYEAAGAHVLWLQLPAPRDAPRQVITRAVDAAIATALQDDPQARILDLRPLISPDDTYRDTVTQDGRQVVIRAEDGIHLSPAGDRIAAGAVLGALNAAGWLDTP